MPDLPNVMPGELFCVDAALWPNPEWRGMCWFAGEVPLIVLNVELLDSLPRTVRVTYLAGDQVMWGCYRLNLWKQLARKRV